MFSYLHMLDMFGRADSSVTDLSITTMGAICPGEVPSHAHQVAAGLSRAPQTTAWGLHKRTRFGVFSEGELTLTVETVGRSWQVVGKN